MQQWGKKLKIGLHKLRRAQFDINKLEMNAKDSVSSFPRSVVCNLKAFSVDM